MTKAELLDEFAVAYRARLEENRPMVELWAALVRLSDFADRPVGLDHLAAALKESTPDTLERLRRWGGDAVRVRDDRVQLHLTFPDRPTNFRIHIGGRTLNTNAGGCAGDTVAVMLWTGKPVRVETTCRTTGTPIRVDLDPSGASTVEPATAVITVADPHSPRFAQIRDHRTGSELICSQQNYYASPQAAADDPPGPRRPSLPGRRVPHLDPQPRLPRGFLTGVRWLVSSSTAAGCPKWSAQPAGVES